MLNELRLSKFRVWREKNDFFAFLLSARTRTVPSDSVHFKMCKCVRRVSTIFGGVTAEKKTPKNNNVKTSLNKNFFKPIFENFLTKFKKISRLDVVGSNLLSENFRSYTK